MKPTLILWPAVRETAAREYDALGLDWDAERLQGSLPT